MTEYVTHGGSGVHFNPSTGGVQLIHGSRKGLEDVLMRHVLCSAFLELSAFANRAVDRQNTDHDHGHLRCPPRHPRQVFHDDHQPQDGYADEKKYPFEPEPHETVFGFFMKLRRLVHALQGSALEVVLLVLAHELGMHRFEDVREVFHCKDSILCQ